LRQITGFQQFTSQSLTGALGVSTALLLDEKSGTRANAALISIGGSTGAIRFRDDGVAPTSNIGMRLPAGVVPFLYQGDLNKIRFIADSVPGNADVNVTYLSVGPQE
jgi:hypothetical protein